MPSFRVALRFWLKLGLISFGGPAGQIAIMHRELVDERRWISEQHFLNALNFSMLLPGPEAQQLATYLGWRLHGVRGGIAAGGLFVLPAMILLFGLCLVFVLGGELPWLAAIFKGLQAAVMAIVTHALLKIGRRSLRSLFLVLIAIAAFVAIFVFKVSFVWIILGAGMLGYLGSQLLARQFPSHGKISDGSVESSFLKLPPPPRASYLRTLKIIGVGTPLWVFPILLFGLVLGWDSTLAQEAIFFSKASMVTFGGAYAVLPYVAQQAVEVHGWLDHLQMMSGLALAETTPGPLVIVLQFVGFMGGWNHPGNWSPWLAAAVGSLVTCWATFVPCFMFIFIGGPHVEGLSQQPRISAALGAITAAVVGVIANLAAILGIHALWPVGGSFELGLLVLAIVAFIALQFFRFDLLKVIGFCGLAGLLYLI